MVRREAYMEDARAEGKGEGWAGGGRTSQEVWW